MLLATNGSLFLAAVGVAFLDRGLMILKWYPLLHIQASSISFGRAARSYFAAGLAGFLIPTPISGDFFRAVALGRGQCAVPEISASIIMERLLGMIGSSLLCLVSLALIFFGTIKVQQHIFDWIVALLIVTFVGFLLSLNRSLATRVSRWTSRANQSISLQNINRFGRAYAVYRDRKTMLVLVGLLSFVEQFFPIFCIWILSQALSASVTFKMLVIAIPLTLFVARLPITVSGIGAAEGTLVYLLGLFGVPSQEAFALALAAATMNIITAVPGLLFWTDAMRPTEEDSGGLGVSFLPAAHDVTFRNSQRS
jgi:uncharacterized protein (TIRG00374 family)